MIRPQRMITVLSKTVTVFGNCLLSSVSVSVSSSSYRMVFFLVEWVFDEYDGHAEYDEADEDTDHYRPRARVTERVRDETGNRAARGSDDELYEAAHSHTLPASVAVSVLSSAPETRSIQITLYCTRPDPNGSSATCCTSPTTVVRVNCVPPASTMRCAREANSAAGSSHSSLRTKKLMLTGGSHGRTGKRSRFSSEVKNTAAMLKSAENCWKAKRWCSGLSGSNGSAPTIPLYMYTCVLSSLLSYRRGVRKRAAPHPSTEPPEPIRKRHHGN